MAIGKQAGALALFLAVLAPVSAVNAASIDYLATPLGGNQWRYDYTVHTGTPSIGFDELTVYFAVGQFDLLSTPTAPAGWDPIVVQPDAGLASDGFYDALNLGAPLAAEAKLAGFSVSFAYLGSGTPGAQRFDLLDSATFEVLHSGTTTPVPEPAAIVMMLLGLSGLYAAGQRQSRYLA